MGLCYDSCAVAKIGHLCATRDLQSPFQPVSAGLVRCARFYPGVLLSGNCFKGRLVHLACSSVL